MFHPPRDSTDSVITVHVDGQPVRMRQGESAAAAVLAAGLVPSRASPLSGTGRAPYCMMGVCFECLMDIDGIPDQRGCMVPVSEGMVIRRQPGGGTP
jgi:D-hydroxyproline dehydrogenase subunit gamma